MDNSLSSKRILVAASPDVSYANIDRYIGRVLDGQVGSRLIFSQSNKGLLRYAKELWPDAESIPTSSKSEQRRALEHSSALLFIWDGEGLTRLLFEARLRSVKTKVIAVQVTKVVNKKNTDQFDIYIGRGSPWGNPFAIGHGDGPDRAEVIAKYKDYFYDRLDTDPSFKRGVLGLRGMRLACFCKPEACHGDIIADYLDNLEVAPETGDD